VAASRHGNTPNEGKTVTPGSGTHTPLPWTLTARGPSGQIVWSTAHGSQSLPSTRRSMERRDECSAVTGGLTALAGGEQEFCDEVEVVGSEVVSAGVMDPAQGIATALDQPEVHVQRNVCGD
jgi:hypothetical protein